MARASKRDGALAAGASGHAASQRTRPTGHDDSAASRRRRRESASDEPASDEDAGLRVFSTAAMRAPPSSSATQRPPAAAAAAAATDESVDEEAIAAVDSDNESESDETIASFESLGLRPWLVQQAALVGLRRPTPVQVQCIPPLLAGRDAIAAAKTGSGKTAAFALPLLQQLGEAPCAFFAVILTPTRELAHQIAEQVVALGRPINVRAVVLTGGADMMKEALALTRRPHVVVATPGRLADHIRSSSVLDFTRTRMLVLDEADRLLCSTFEEDLACLLDHLPKERQTLLFSATISPSVREAARRSARGQPFQCEIVSSEMTVRDVEQRYVFIPATVRDAYLIYLLQQNTDDYVIVFAATTAACASLAAMALEMGLSVTALHGALRQRERLQSLSRFRAKIARILIATDVAARGLDIPQVSLVINHGVPRSATTYIHRVGRTARHGSGGGRAITLVTQYDANLVKMIEKEVGKQWEALEVPEDAVLALLPAVLRARRAAATSLSDENPRLVARSVQKWRKLG